MTDLDENGLPHPRPATNPDDGSPSVSDDPDPEVIEPPEVASDGPDDPLDL